MITLHSRFGVGARVSVMSLPAEILSIIFTKDALRYEVKFDSGGADGVFDSAEVGEPRT